ncbi:DnaD domain-containing protein [Ferdinandcohnia quinoae]|uniref:DnaD domain protein n=1 Tax=Fredinandcohnia quinoae TaxID=2918902 RepID=A0AAW5EAR1_9BACI|nr:DnaD domain protein [Fredinandcohnia sp. SECRCQ15]MCH1626755.1 DnaD domain protein [Fredinandcohnia sp. SECRCQ15]
MSSNLIINSRPLMVIPELAVKIGLNESIVLQQLHYWLQRSKNVRLDRKWVYFTYDKLVEQFPFFSKSTIRRTIARLEDLGLLLSDCFNKMKMDHTKWYSINYETLTELDSQGEETNISPAIEETVETQQTEIHSQLEVATQELNLHNGQNEKQNQSTLNNNTNLATEVPSQTLPSSSKADLNPFQFYEENGFGVRGGFISKKIHAWCNDLSEELVIEAMKLAVENGSARWNYVEAVLSDWVDKGYQSVEDVHSARLAYKQRQKQQVSNQQKAIRKEIIPTWLCEEQKQSPKTLNPNFEEEKRKIEERIRGLDRK